MAESTDTPDSTREIIERLSSLAERIEDKLVEVAPEAYEALVRINQIEAAGELLWGVFSLILAIASTKITYRVATNWRWYREVRGHRKVKASTFLSVTASVAVALFGWIHAGVALLDIWNWAAFTHPDVALAHRVLEQSGIW